MDDKIKILIVDDVPVNVNIIQEILDFEEGFSYRIASTGEEALEVLKTFFPDIVLLDIMMPGMNGYEVCRRIKQDPNHRFAKILMVTGKAMIEERLIGYGVGADDYVTKPFVDDELLAKINVFSRLKKTEEVDLLKTSILQLFSHETKTPLNGILLGSQLILEDESIAGKVREYAELIKVSGERIHDLVQKILLLSNLRNNKKLDRIPNSIKAYLIDLIEQEKKSNKKNIEFTLDCPGDIKLLLDWQLFHTAIKSIIDNAIKYSAVKGRIELECQVNSSKCTIKVSDFGSGIDPSIQNHIFDEFFTDKITNHSQGTALSLPIARQIMNLHNGNLEVSSAPGEKTTFTFSFPAEMFDHI